jgi:hypothetical protein
MGVMATLKLVRLNVFVETHACDADSAAEPLKVPAVEADQIEMCVRVSEVPPLVHDDAIDDIALEPPDAAAMVACTRVVEPAAAAVAPAEPGSAVWSLMKQDAVAKSVSSHELTRVALRPTVIRVLLRW